MEAAPSPSAPALCTYAKLLPTKLLRAHVILGAIQVTLGCLLMVLNTYGLLAADHSVNSHLGSGFWTGVFFIPAGATGLAAGKGRKRTLCCIISCLVLSVIAATVSLTALIMGPLVAALSEPSARIVDCQSNSQWKYSNYDLGTCIFAREGLWCLAFLFGLVVAIVHAVFACRASCCCVADAADRQPLTEFADSEAGAQPSGGSDVGLLQPV